MCFHASRFDSRIDENNTIVILEKQDRTKWSKELIGLGYKYLNISSQGNELSGYHIESAIAAEHCMTSSFQDTNWERMLVLYDLLWAKKPTATVILNRAVVKSQLNRIISAIEDIMNMDDIEKLLNSQYIYSAVLGDLYFKNEDVLKAKKYLTKALELTTSAAEKKLISNKLQKIDARCRIQDTGC